MLVAEVDVLLWEPETELVGVANSACSTRRKSGAPMSRRNAMAAKTPGSWNRRECFHPPPGRRIPLLWAQNCRASTTAQFATVRGSVDRRARDPSVRDEYGCDCSSDTSRRQPVLAGSGLRANFRGVSRVIHVHGRKAQS